MDVRTFIEESLAVKRALLEDAQQIAIRHIGTMIVEALQAGKKILIAGNGGSAADAQHFAAELTGRFMIERQGLAALALTTNTSIITAVANDFSYDEIFARQVEAYGSRGDIFFGISTSGNSKNILSAFTVAKQKNLTTIGLLGNDGGKAKPLCDAAVIVPSVNTQHIQEAHVVLIHIWSAMVDAAWAPV